MSEKHSPVQNWGRRVVCGLGLWQAKGVHFHWCQPNLHMPTIKQMSIVREQWWWWWQFENYQCDIEFILQSQDNEYIPQKQQNEFMRSYATIV